MYEWLTSLRGVVVGFRPKVKEMTRCLGCRTNSLTKWLTVESS